MYFFIMQGIYIYKDGDKYEGEFVYGKFNGKGHYFYKNKKKYCF